MSHNQTNHKKRFLRLLRIPTIVNNSLLRSSHKEVVHPSGEPGDAKQSLRRTETQPDSDNLYTEGIKNEKNLGRSYQTWNNIYGQDYSSEKYTNSFELTKPDNLTPTEFSLTMGNVHQGRSLKSHIENPSLSVATNNTTGNNKVSSNSNNIQPPPRRFQNGVNSDRQTEMNSFESIKNMEAMTSELKELRSIIQEKDRRIEEFKSEINKLKAVLDQHTAECSNFKKLPNPPIPPRSFDSDICPDEQTENTDSLPDSKSSPNATTQFTSSLVRMSKKLGVSAEPTIQSAVPVEMKYYEKDAKTRQDIHKALRNNDFLKSLDAIQLQEIVSCMYDHDIVEGCYVIHEGEDGHHLYVAAEGEYEVWKGGKYLYTMGPGNCFGELALLYNCKRTASIKAVRCARIWVLQRSIFQYIMRKTGIEKMEERVEFLSSVPLLKKLDDIHLQRITDVLEAQFHQAGDCILRQGEQADSFFIIQSGEVRVTMKIVGSDGSENEVDIRKMAKGEYFGEKALLEEGKRTANIYAVSPNGVNLLCLYRKDFLELMGDIEDLKHKEYVNMENLVNKTALSESVGGNVKIDHGVRTSVSLSDRTGDTVSRLNLPQKSLDQQLKPNKNLTQTTNVYSKKTFSREYEITRHSKLTDYKRVAVIGQGGFGRVELIRPISDNSMSFALKRMKKVHIVLTKQQDHVHSEKRILMAVDCSFICKLFKTFKDTKFVYMLMEFCPGGELWTVLRDRRMFDDKLTRFSLACVIEAFAYLHHNLIIYRDLKPENMLLTTTGYIKLCDFGFAKRLGSQPKTWTFCGTPEYVAPEVILNKGHNFAADYWSLGILTCELLMGTPPFQASEPIKIYMKALRGIEAHDLGNHKNISTKAYQFIKRLCRMNPNERLGMGHLGIQDIRSQKYFQGFDWDGIRKHSFVSPFRPKVSGPFDVSNFDQFPLIDEMPPDELSGWDKDF